MNSLGNGQGQGASIQYKGGSSALDLAASFEGIHYGCLASLATYVDETAPPSIRIPTLVRSSSIQLSRVNRCCICRYVYSRIHAPSNQSFVFETLVQHTRRCERPVKDFAYRFGCLPCIVLRALFFRLVRVPNTKTLLGIDFREPARAQNLLQCACKALKRNAAGFSDRLTLGFLEIYLGMCALND